MARRNSVKSNYQEPVPNEFYCWGETDGVGIVSRKSQAEKQIQNAFDSITIEEDKSTPETDYVLKVLGKDSGARIVIPFDAVIKDAYFNPETKEIVLIVATAEGDKEIKVSVKDLVDTYTGDDVTIKVEDHVISITQEVMDKFDELKNSIEDEERRADASEKSLKKAIDDEVKRATEAERGLEEELVEKTKNMVEWQYSTEDRKHIVLGNHENILGTSTDGETYNLAMVSKWDVADFGSSQLHTNLNSKDGEVTINDDKIVATTEDVSTEKDRAEAAEKENAEAIINVEKELIEKTKNMVEWQYSTEDRKHIVLGNHENILGTSTDGSTYNIAMVSKWDVVDLGSSQMPLNFNSKNGKITVNDNEEILTTANSIPLSKIQALFE